MRRRKKPLFLVQCRESRGNLIRTIENSLFMLQINAHTLRSMSVKDNWISVRSRNQKRVKPNGMRREKRGDNHDDNFLSELSGPSLRSPHFRDMFRYVSMIEQQRWSVWQAKEMGRERKTLKNRYHAAFFRPII